MGKPKDDGEKKDGEMDTDKDEEMDTKTGDEVKPHDASAVEGGEDQAMPPPDKPGNEGDDDESTDEPPTKRQKKDDGEHSERFITLTLNLPPRGGKLGLVLMDDKNNLGVPILVALR